MRQKSIKKRRILWPIRITLVLLAGFLLTVTLPSQEQSEERVSKFGEYKGYSEARFDGYVRRSVFVN